MSGESSHSDSEIEVISRSESVEDMLDAMLEEDLKALNLDSLKKNLAKSSDEVIKSLDAEVEKLQAQLAEMTWKHEKEIRESEEEKRILRTRLSNEESTSKFRLYQLEGIKMSHEMVQDTVRELRLEKLLLTTEMGPEKTTRRTTQRVDQRTILSVKKMAFEEADARCHEFMQRVNEEKKVWTAAKEKAETELEVERQKTAELEGKLMESQRLIDELKKKSGTLEIPKMENKPKGRNAINGKWKYMTSIGFGDFEDEDVRQKFEDATLHYELTDAEFSTWMEKEGQELDKKSAPLNIETTVSRGRTSKTTVIGDRVLTIEKYNDLKDIRRECRIEKSVTNGLLRVCIRAGGNRTLVFFTRV